MIPSTRTRRRTLTATTPMTMIMRRMKRGTSPPARKELRERTIRRLTKTEKEKTLRMLTMRKREKETIPRILTMRETKTEREKEKTLMRMKMQKMTSVNGKTGASGLVNAAHSLADALVVILEPGLLTTSCLTLAAADSSV